MKKKDKSSVTIFTSKFLTIGVTLIVLPLLGLGLFTVIYEPIRTGIGVLTWCIMGFFCGLLPLLLLTFGARECFSVIRIDKSGVKLLAYGFIKLIEMNWDDIAEIRYHEKLASPFVKAFLPFVLISKTKSLSGKTLYYAEKQKDILQIQMNKKIYDIICNYAMQPIEGLTEEKLTELKWTNQKK